MNLTTSLRDDSQDQDGIPPQAINDYDPLVLLIVVAVLSTLLAVVFVACLLWICFKCCIQSVWFLKPRSWPSHTSKTFPPSQRDFVEMNEIGAGRNSIADRRPGGLKSVFASNRTGISERLGYGRANRKVTAIPFLPPPKTWTPSPPFLPGGHLPPARPNPRRPNPELIHLQCNKSEDNDLPNHAITQCQYCGTVQCCPAELEEKLKRVQRKSHRSFRRTKFDLNMLSSSKCSALRPPHNTPRKMSSPNNNGNLNLDLQNVLEEGDSVYEIFPERNLIVHTAENKDLGQTNPEAQSVHSLGHSSKYPRNEQPVCYGRLIRSFSQPEMGSADLATSSVMQGCNVNEGSSIQTVVKTTGARKKRRESIKARKNGMPPPVEVFIESPSSSSSSSTDLTTILNRSQKIYWKIYHPPEGEKTLFFEDELDDQDESDEGQIKDGDDAADDDDEYATDATPSMTWDHLTPDPSPIPTLLSKSDDRIIMNVAADSTVHYSVKKGSACSVGKSDGHTSVPRGMYSADDRKLEHRNYAYRATNPFNSQGQQPPIGNL